MRAVLVAVFLSGCRSTGEDLRQVALLQLAANREKWFTQSIHDYSFDYDKAVNIFSPPVHIEVRADLVTQVIDRNSGAVYPSAGRPTVDSLFREIEGLINNPNADFKVEYDPAMGYPILIEINSNIPDTGSSEGIANLQRVP